MKNRFLSLGWFLEKLNLEQKKDKPEESKPEVKSDRLYVAIKLVNSSLSVVLADGSILSKPNATELDYQNCLEAKTREEIEKIISDTRNVPVKKEEKKEPEEIITKEVVKTITKGFEALGKLKDFRVDGDVVYWGKIKRSMPQQLVVALCKLVENGGTPLEQKDLETNDTYLSLKKFWLKCCLNPNSQSAEDLYTFLSNHKFKIDRHGNFYAYRRVKTTETNVNKPLAEFVSNAFTKVRAVWKKSPKNFTVTNSKEEGYAIHDTSKKPYDGDDFLVGNLAELYENLSKNADSSYTSAHTGKEDYRIGEVISMPRDQGDSNNNVSCSTGFHAASKKYDYSGFGDTPILMIINPMDVLSVPKGEVGKLRTCRWFFACVLDEKEKYILDEDKFDVTNLGDIFEEKIHQNLDKDIKKGFAEEIKRHKFYVPSVNEEDIKVIVKSLEDMQKEIKSRIKKI